MMRKLNSILRTKPVFLFLLPIFFVFHESMQNYPVVPFWDAFKLILNYLVSELILLFFFYLIFKSWKKAALFTFLLMSIYLFFGAMHDFLKRSFGHLFLTKYSFLFPAFALLSVIVFLGLRRSTSSFNKSMGYFAITLIFLIGIDAAVFAYKWSTSTRQHEQIPGFVDCGPCKKPNIYLILADEYAGPTELKEFLSFDNSAFDKELLKRNFYQIKYPRSNYNYTIFSMASIFSMDYLPGITDRANGKDNRIICYERINKNALATVLERLGYEFVNLSPFDFAGRQTKRYNGGEFHSTGGRIISSQTLSARIEKDLWFHLITSLKLNWAKENFHAKLYKNIRDEYDGTVDVAKKKHSKPLFIYTHFIMPHYPYLFDRNGRKLSFEEAEASARKDLYLEYLLHSNKQYLSLIDSILESDKTEPIIILMSDHGFTKYASSPVDSAYNFNNVINIHFPDKDYSGIPDTLYNVNLFRTILNQRFKQQFPLLKDSSIFLREY